MAKKFDRDMYELLFPNDDHYILRKPIPEVIGGKDEHMDKLINYDFPRDKVDSDLQMNLFTNYKRVPVDMLQGKLFIFGRSGTGKSVAMAVIAEELTKINYPFTIFDPAGDFVSVSQLNPDMVVHHVSKVKGNERKVAKEIFEKGMQAVINMEGELDMEVRRACVLEYLTEVQQLAMKYKEKGQGIVHAIIMDEVKDYIPSISSGTAVRSPTLNKIRALIGWFATDGRKYGTTLICASQRPAYLESGVVSQFGNYFLFGVEPADLEKYREYLKTPRGKISSAESQIMFRNLKPGEAWINLAGMPNRVKFRLRQTKHKGKTPSLTESRSVFRKNRGDFE